MEAPTDDRMRELLARKGIQEPNVLDYSIETSSKYFEDLREYNKKLGFLQSEAMNKRLNERVEVKAVGTRAELSR